MSAKRNKTTLDQFVHHVRVPNELSTDKVLELILSDRGKKIAKHSIIQYITEPDTPKMNLAESQGGIVKYRA